MKKPKSSSGALPRLRAKRTASSGKAVQIPMKWHRYYRTLKEQRDALLAQSRNLLREAREPVGTAGTHVAESGTDEFERRLHFSLLSTEQDALREVEAAIRRIEGGSFGVCEISGKRIPAARLRALPWTRYTAEVESELEKARRTGFLAQSSLQFARGSEVETRRKKAPQFRSL